MWPEEFRPNPPPPPLFPRREGGRLKSHCGVLSRLLLLSSYTQLVYLFTKEEIPEKKKRRRKIPLGKQTPPPQSPRVEASILPPLPWAIQGNFTRTNPAFVTLMFKSSPIQQPYIFQAWPKTCFFREGFAMVWVAIWGKGLFCGGPLLTSSSFTKMPNSARVSQRAHKRNPTILCVREKLESFASLMACGKFDWMFFHTPQLEKRFKGIPNANITQLIFSSKNTLSKRMCEACQSLKWCNCWGPWRKFTIWVEE